MKIRQPTIHCPDGETTVLLLLRADNNRQRREIRRLVTQTPDENTVSGSFKMMQIPFQPNVAAVFQTTIQQVLGNQVSQMLVQLDKQALDIRQRLRERGYTKPIHIRDGYRHLINTYGLPLLMGGWTTPIETRTKLFHAMCCSGNLKALGVVEKVIGFSSPQLRPVVLQLRREIMAARRRKQRRHDVAVVKKIMTPPETPPLPDSLPQ